MGCDVASCLLLCSSVVLSSQIQVPATAFGVSLFFVNLLPFPFPSLYFPFHSFISISFFGFVSLALASRTC